MEVGEVVKMPGMAGVMPGSVMNVAGRPGMRMNPMHNVLVMGRPVQSGMGMAMRGPGRMRVIGGVGRRAMPGRFGGRLARWDRFGPQTANHRAENREDQDRES